MRLRMAGVLALVLSTALVAPLGAEQRGGCEVNHNATEGNITTTVKVCDSIDGALGYSYYGNDTIMVSQEGNLAQIYIHELGHQMGLEHESGTVMGANTSTVSTDGAERIARAWNTTTVENGEVQTPFGSL